MGLLEMLIIFNILFELHKNINIKREWTYQRYHTKRWCFFLIKDVASIQGVAEKDDIKAYTSPILRL